MPATFHKHLTIDDDLLVTLTRLHVATRTPREIVMIFGQVEAQPINAWTALRLAYTHAALGNRDEALRWLEYEPSHAHAAWVAANPQFEAYRDDPRFQAVMRRRNLRIEPGTGVRP